LARPGHYTFAVPQLGPLEILMIAVVALVVFGPEKLPDIARTVARTLGELRRVASEVRSEFQSGLEVDDDQAVPRTNGKVSDHPMERAIEADTKLTRDADRAQHTSATSQISNHPDAGPIGPGTTEVRDGHASDES
jgi:Tat protein translocase TatB subunit